MTKEEKIKEAWGSYWDDVKEFVTLNGWVECTHVLFLYIHDELDANFEATEPDRSNFKPVWGIRPKSLSGIEE